MKKEVQQRLHRERNIWIATVRPDGRPHMTPVWFVLWGERLVVCISDQSVKASNLSRNQHVAMALEDGSSPLICEGTAELISAPFPSEVRRAFQEKYDWEIATDQDYNLLVAISPLKWLRWGDDN